MNGTRATVVSASANGYYRDMTYFFAYGERMNPELMTGAMPGATAVGPARLPGYRLVFNVMSRAWGGGAANAEVDPASSMWGVLWDVGEQDPTNLESSQDEAEHAPIEVTVEGPDGSVTAQTLTIWSGERFVRPTERYVAMLRANAEKQGLPADALEEIDNAAQGNYGPAPSI
jgi:AIG2-like family